MMKKNFKSNRITWCLWDLEITTPAVTFAETSTTDTSGMSDEEVYEKALDYAKSI